MKKKSLAPFNLSRKIKVGSYTFFFLLFLLSNFYSSAQKKEEYRKAIHERSLKIVNTLQLTDSVVFKRVLHNISNQYFELNIIQEQNKAAVDSVKAQNISKELQVQALKRQEEKKAQKTLQLHQQFTALLKRDLSESQLEKVKDGMTYRILPITYKAYQDMIPNLSNEQKEKIYSWLLEARELAMDAESSEKKHAVFGKYKGRINNYLSAAGYDLKKEGEDWEKRKTQVTNTK